MTYDNAIPTILDPMNATKGIWDECFNSRLNTPPYYLIFFNFRVEWFTLYPMLEYIIICILPSLT